MLESEVNPYAAPAEAVPPPAAPEQPREDFSYWRERDLLVCLNADVVLPDRCVQCNSPAEGYRLERTLYWHSPWLHILALAPLLYILIALAARARGTVHVGVCPNHRRRRGRAIASGWLGVVCLVGGIAAGTEFGGGAAVLGVAVALALGFIAWVFGRLIYAMRIESDSMRLRVGADFLRSIAPLPAAPRAASSSRAPAAPGPPLAAS